MCVLDETTDRGHMKESHLPFEGFLEALVRICSIKATPFDSQIEEAACAAPDKWRSGAAAYVERLRAQDEDSYQEMLRTQGSPWGEPPKQPLHRCLAHLCALIINEVEKDGGGTANRNMELTPQEANFWVSRHAAANK